jgi:cholesterol oxidase
MSIEEGDRHNRCVLFLARAPTPVNPAGADNSRPSEHPCADASDASGTPETDVAWLGQGLECLVARFPHIDRESLAELPSEHDVDLVIVGSGYGAAVAAREFAGGRVASSQMERERDRKAGKPETLDRPISICILERGNEYLPGAFPSRFADLAGHVRFSTPGRTAPRGRPLGLFDVRVGGDVDVLVANGVGGGSLINAGVMLQPGDSVLRSSGWPRAIRDDPMLPSHFDVVGEWLGAGTKARPNTVAGTSSEGLDKTSALHRIDGSAQPVPITVALRPGARTVAGVPLSACVNCGDCATGCNHGAKISLDVGLLAQACRTPGVALYTGATVLRLERPEGEGEGWVLVVQHTDAQLRRRQGAPFRLRARRVILAAGALGSTEILLRSRRQDQDQGRGRGLNLSGLLGHRFSANGDMIASVHAQEASVRAVADEDAPPRDRRVGPTITAMIDRRDATDPARRCVIQDLAVPGALRRVFGEVFATATTLHALEERDGDDHRAGSADPQAVDPAVVDRSLPVAVIGHDGSGGRLSLVPSAPGADPDREGDGALRIDWPELKALPVFDERQKALQALVGTAKGAGRVLPNPVWKPLPDAMRGELGMPRGPLLTVHPLGGCAMGESALDGVVDHLGRVFDPGDPGMPEGTGIGAPRVHDGLAVLDGAIVPTSLGVNPALTIAALARRAAQALRPRWSITAAEPPAEPPPHRPRPVFRHLPAVPTPARPTAIELVERMRGEAAFADGRRRWIELTLHSQPTRLRDLMRPAVPRRIVLDPARCGLRVYEGPLAPGRDEPDSAQVVLTAMLAGRLDIFGFVPSTPWRRIWRGLLAWLPNRGVRDLTQQLLARRASVEPSPPDVPAVAPGRGKGLLARGWAWLRRRVGGILALASRAGAARRLDYEFTVTQASGALARDFADGTRLSGFKQLAYERGANPLEQLMTLTLTRFPGLAAGGDPKAARPRLALHLPFLAAQGVPLMRVVDQQDQPTALLDLASFAAYVGRILIDGHLWSFRKPDAASARVPQRLPGFVPGAPVPEVRELAVAQRVDDAGATVPVLIRLTRYRPKTPDSGLPPVLLIHGYSASGTTFAHPTLSPGLMGHLTGVASRDVWILDMRSSCGMPTAHLPWAFEDMGYEDIPVAVDHVCRATGFERIDIVAHCMGSAMLCMGLLGDVQGGPARSGRHEGLRRALWDRDHAHRDAATPPRGRIRRLVMSQVGPALLLAPANVARAYLMRYVKQFLAGRDYRFRPGPDDGAVDQLLDRLLAALPYPSGEFERENPLWPPGRHVSWVGARHRIDALFGRVLNLAHTSDATLEHIDDFFGPFNVDTVSQVMHFARYRLITDRNGFNRFVDPQRLRERLDFPILSLHAPANGLVDAGSRALLEELLAHHCGPNGSFRSRRLTPVTLGHQDSLIGDAKATRSALRAITRFLR